MAERPLSGRTVALTRPASAAGAALAARLRELGAEVLEVPAITIVPPEDLAPLDAALGERFDWLVFTSANAVRAVAGRLSAAAIDAPAGRARIAAVGQATAAALEGAGLRAEVVAGKGGAEALLEAMPRGALDGASVLLPRAEQGLDVFPDGARARGADVRVVTAYRTEARPEAARAIGEALDAGRLDAVVFTSPSGVRAVIGGLGERASGLSPVLLVGIGPTTTRALEDLGLAAVHPDRPGNDEIVELLLVRLGRRA